MNAATVFGGLLLGALAGTGLLVATRFATRAMRGQQFMLSALAAASAAALSIFVLNAALQMFGMGCCRG